MCFSCLSVSVAVSAASGFRALRCIESDLCLLFSFLWQLPFLFFLRPSPLFLSLISVCCLTQKKRRSLPLPGLGPLWFSERLRRSTEEQRALLVQRSQEWVWPAAWGLPAGFQEKMWSVTNTWTDHRPYFTHWIIKPILAALCFGSTSRCTTTELFTLCSDAACLIFVLLSTISWDSLSLIPSYLRVCLTFLSNTDLSI